TRVVAQVEDQRGRAFGDEVLEMLDELFVQQLVIERGEADVADVVGQHGAGDIDDLDGGALDLEHQRLGNAGTVHRDRHGRALGSPDDVGDVGGGHVSHVDAVDLEEDVAALEPRAG